MTTPPTANHLDRHALVRSAHGRAVLETILRRGPISRVQLATLTGLSKPNVNELVRGFERRGLVHPAGRTSGRAGRQAVLYQVDPGIAHIIGVDLGGTKLHVALADLFGEIISERRVPTKGEGGEAVLNQIVTVCREVVAEAGSDWSTVQTLSLGTPGVLDPSVGRVDLAVNVAGLGDVDLVARLKEELDVEVLIENDVNAAAIGERWRGCASARRSFAFIAVGTGVGMGLVVNGELLHGSRGAAGEVAYLPLGGDPFDPVMRERGTLETMTSGSGIRALAARRRRAAPRQTSLSAHPTVEQVFASAEEGDPVALGVIDEVGQLLALLVASVAAVVDPELVVFGGGIGARPLLVDAVRRRVAQVLPWPVEIAGSALGERAAVFGALKVGLESTHKALFGALELDVTESTSL